MDLSGRVMAGHSQDSGVIWRKAKRKGKGRGGRKREGGRKRQVGRTTRMKGDGWIEVGF